MAGGGFDAFPEYSAESLLTSIWQPTRSDDCLSLVGMFEMQSRFMSQFHDTKVMTPPEREELSKTLILSLHGEAASLANCINYRDHRSIDATGDVSISRLTHEAVDVIRYAIGILNTWGVTPSQFSDAYCTRDNFLNTRHRMSLRQYVGQPIVIVDMDDVIVRFRDGFTDWLETQGIQADRNSTEYYYVSAVTGCKDFNSETFYRKFIEEHGIRDMLPPNADIIDVVNRLHNAGFWIQVLTARPGDNLTCVYDTYEWLVNNGVMFDRIDFAGEKFLWLMKSEIYDIKDVVCALEDSAKHAAEYARHGVHVFAPTMTYNKTLVGMENVTMYETSDGLYDRIVKRAGGKLE